MATATATLSKKGQSGSSITVPNEESLIVDDSPLGEPYFVEFQIEGTRGYLFNRYDVPVGGSGGLKGEVPKNDLRYMVTLDSKKHLAASKLQVWNAVCAAGKYRKNPRSSKGSFATILREGIEVESLDEDHPDLLTFEGPNGQPYERWEWEDTRRTKKSGAFAGFVTKVRPALYPGWRLSGRVVVLLPQYISIPQLHEAFEMAGRFGGIGDGRTGGLGYGRFLVRSFKSD